MDLNDEEAEAPGLERNVSRDEDLAQSKGEYVKPTYKSFKKKYRKMRMKFDEKMRESNAFFLEEQKAVETARRLAEQNDRLLDLLLDVNNSAQIPAEKRIDLDVDTPALSNIPPLIIPEELATAAEFNTPAGQAIYNEICNMLEEREAEKAISKPAKSLARLMANTPHLSLNSSLVPPGLLSSLEPIESHLTPIAYLTADQMDDCIYDIDASLGLVPPPPPHTRSPTQTELALKNPHSVYNWLRRNEPKIFLQDGEGSEKSLGKPGSLRGAGKRASMPGPSKPDSLEIVEEDGLGYDPTIGGLEPTKGKRKRDDDGVYHPKAGRVDEGKVKKPRAKKKKTEGLGETNGSTGSRRSKGKGRGSSPMAIDPSPLVSS